MGRLFNYRPLNIHGGLLLLADALNCAPAFGDSSPNARPLCFVTLTNYGAVCTIVIVLTVKEFWYSKISLGIAQRQLTTLWWLYLIPTTYFGISNCLDTISFEYTGVYTRKRLLFMETFENTEK